MVRKTTYFGLFLVTLAMLMYEILLTRIFSVTMWYHLAFVAISVAMFGMTIGALLVYLIPSFFTEDRAKFHLSLSSLLFAVSIVFSFLTYLSIPLVRYTPFFSAVRLYSLALTYVVISIPFVFCGICVCLALTKFPRQVSRLYAADLAGAALGCILLVYILEITDGPTAVVAVAFLAAVGSACFSVDAGRRRLLRAAVVISVLLACFGIFHTALVHKHRPILQLVWIRGGQESRSLCIKWNSFSRIRVWGDPDRLEPPFGWGLSSVYASAPKVKQLHMNIDAAAFTPITAFNGDVSNLDYLKYDITNIAHYIRPNSKVLVIGSGGGRDILSALVFDQKSVLGVEINKDIIQIVNERYGDFSGHLDRHPNVKVVNDEARSYIARQSERFDIIQSSLIDTWAATAAGAFVLTENAVYTVEAWKSFLEHLTPDGLLTFSRWYLRDKPGETLRLTSLAAASLIELGVENPRDHIVILANTHLSEASEFQIGVGTIIVSRQPLTTHDLDAVEELADSLKFDLVLSPRASISPDFETVASGRGLDAFATGFALKIDPPRDDSPFFFHMLRFRDMFRSDLWEKQILKSNLMAVVILGSLLIVVLGLTFLCIIVPLLLTANKRSLRNCRADFIFFAAIGLGFMLVEISQLQRLIVFLGHPTYGLSVVLFALLLSGGIGSYFTQSLWGQQLSRRGAARLLLLLIVLVIFGIATPYAIHAARGAVTPVRIVSAAVLLFPLGVFMGMAFPLGMKIASNKSASLTPWLWGINGATSVCASVIAVVIALSWGISASFWVGFICYVIAFLAFLWSSREAASA
ncbi:MAG: hypothetical protein GTO51_06270 [Candidatus Latescibacteria bacterium]|nr:hypothetical protein [Candidatus Latescibacterota bacterium]NIM21396.1 hypothetical protein [Candidatus Latescibacterota bacterium]NIM65577.1 hypothetical protein [Candidatus Latescibacterota bacterium]NIO01957.1 hypothetical protein [Candidatus Latescibacterota bacterium]NIO28770.1 hypothetical protein [Candidatus Latescibacterota bacterium]